MMLIIKSRFNLQYKKKLLLLCCAQAFNGRLYLSVVSYLQVTSFVNYNAPVTPWCATASCYGLFNIALYHT